MSQSDDNSSNSNPFDSSSQEESQASQFDTLEKISAADDEIESDDKIEIPKRIGHYDIEAVLGAGGMGLVFKGFDPKLNRYAALKLLHAQTPQLSRRFAQEARLQAKIDHENVCKVYEVGEVDGKHFIAMQFISGKTLRAVAKELKLEEKIRIIKQVADALHSAHKEGLIHRDIKPTNIMVIKTEEGIWRPYILDFGLARDQEAAGLTQSGFIVGTPHYMAPEQARGETNRLDRRTDVYALGATLYELLSGRTPYPGKSSAEVLLQVLQEDPQPIRKIDPTLPMDLETIVMKCMQKEPQQRYESAKELFEDLQRYLDGDPISARPIRLSERILKKARKNKVTAAILGGALLITLVLLTTLIWLQTKASVQSRYAREFGEEVRGIESMMASVYSAPLHDITGELALARKRLAKIENRTRKAGRWAYGPGHNALGLGYFALDDYDKALQNLEIAWQSNYREPSTIYALGKIYGIRYQLALREAESIKNKALRDQQIARIEKELKIPAISFLKMSRTSIDSTAFAEGLIAFYEKRYSDALKKSIEANKQAGWSYDAKKLEGDLYLFSGRELENKGDNEKALKNYEAAGAAYRTAIELGRSRAEIYVSESDRWTTILNQYGEKGASNEEAFNSALRLADQAISINREAPEGYARKMKVYTTAGSYLMYNTGEDPRTMMQKAIAMGEEAQKRNPNDPVAFDQPGIAYRLIGEYELRHGMDPSKALTQSIQNFQKSLQLKPGNSPVLGSLGVTYSIQGEYEWKHGFDPRPSFRNAIQQYQSSTQINPKYTPVYTNAGIAYWYIGIYEMGRGLDPRAAFQDAVQQYQKSIQMNPNNSFAYFNMSLVFMDSGKYEMMLGHDPSSFYDQCLKALQKSSEQMSNAYLPSGLGSVYYYMAEYQMERGNDPTSLLNLSRASFEKSIQTDASYYEPLGFLGRSETLAGRWAIKNGQSPIHFFQKARKAFQKSIVLNKEEASLYQLTADMYLREAEWLQGQKRSAHESISTGLQMVEKAIKIDSQSSEAYALQGTLYLLKAEELKPGELRTNLIQQSKASLESALKMNRWLERQYGPVLQRAKKM